MLSQRIHSRLNFGINVYSKSGKNLGFVDNMSTEGFFIETSGNFDMDEIFEITFELPDTLTKITAKCQVVWKNNKGIGSKISMNSENEKAYFQFIGGFSKIMSSFYN